MSKYCVLFEKDVEKDLLKLSKNEPKSFKKALTLIDELYEHPKTGTGHPEPLRGNRVNQWSRRISDKHRLIYEIRDTGYGKSSGDGIPSKIRKDKSSRGTIETGKCIDRYCTNLQDAKKWMEFTGGKIFIQIIPAQG